MARTAGLRLGLILLLGVGTLSAQPAVAMDAELDEMAGLYHAGDYEAVYEASVRLLEQHPGDPFLLRLKGICQMDLGQTRAAMATLLRALEADPDSIASRYYLAQGHAYEGELNSAAQRLGEILALAPDSAYAEQARRILPELENMASVSAALPERRRWNLYLSVRGEYDDNIPARSRNDADTSPTDSWRVTASLYGEFRLLDETISRSPVTLGLGYSLYATWHDEDAFEGYDVLNHRGTLFAEKRGTLFSRSQSFRLAGHYAVTELGGDPFNDAWEAEAEWRFWWLRRSQVRFHGGWETRSYEHAAEFPDYFSRDGDEWQAGVGHYVYGWNNRVRLGLTYAYRDSDTEGSQYRLRSHQGGASLWMRLPLGLRFSCSAHYAERDYVDFLPEPRRIDDVWTGNASLSRAFVNEKVDLRAGYSTVRSSSIREFAAFKRQVVTLGLSLAL